MDSIDGIRLRLREGKDDDIAEWYKNQADRSTAVREAIRAQIRRERGGQDEVIRQAVNQGLAQLPDVVAAAVQSALAECQFTSVRSSGPMDEDPVLAASLDEQLDGFV